ncbi:reverse transcriptase domain-containing protein [Arthrobacter sp. TMP15]|uniref:reverse transcriptase domain-containing protein n=1 Tax=Arthrobacter sp. TMP15 TaxID=3140789 RepID=UPI0031BADDE2
MNVGEDPRARSDVARVKVQRMQVKLHRWAGSDPGKKFNDLFNLVCDPDFLLVAWERVASNRGAQTPGIDQVTKETISFWVGAEEFIDHIRGLLRTDSFRPQPVRRVEIPKVSGKIRQLGIPTLADRVVQASLKLVLEPIFEADFQPSSYGFRPNRRAQDAIADIHHYTSHGYETVLEADIKACFDRIDHTAR